VSGPVDVGPARHPAAEETPPVQWAPALLATCIGLPLLGLRFLMGVFGLALMHSGAWCPRGTICLEPSRHELLANLTVWLVPLVLGIALLGCTWRQSLHGHRLSSWVLALGTIATGVLAFAPIA
jgi:hypothetical protein